MTEEEIKQQLEKEGHSPAFIVRENCYYSTLWQYEFRPPYVPGEFGQGGNYLQVFWRDLSDPPGEWRLHVRFRYYKDDRIFEHGDKFSVYESKLTGRHDELLRKLDMVVVGAALIAGVTKVNRVEIRGLMDEFQQKLTEMPFMHMKFETKGKQQQ